jgi:glycosyltransferase involved in cell wall biosynthesis
MIGPDLDVPGGVSAVENAILQYPPPGVQVDFHPTLTRHGAAAALRNQPIRYFARGVKNLSSFVFLLNSLKKRISNYDLVHIHLSTRASTFRKYFVCKYTRRENRLHILHNHGGSYREFFAQLSPLLQSKVRGMFLSARGTIVLSEQWLQFHREMLGTEHYPLWVLSNPVELPSLEGISAECTAKLLFLGRIGEHKGADRILRAIAKLPDAVRGRVRLCMAGDGAVDEACALAEQLGLASQVEIRGWIAGAEKEAWMRQTNVFILPSRNEGLPMAMLEAMAWGKALIVSPVGGIPEFVTDGVEGFLVPPDDIDAIADAIRKLAENPDLRVQMGMAARKRVEPLDIQNYRIRLGEIYREALG